MSEPSTDRDSAEGTRKDPWYKWGIVMLYLEMSVAVTVTTYALVMAFSGQAGLLVN